VEHLFELVPSFVAVGQPGWSAHVSGYEDLVVLGDDAAGTSPVAGGALGNGVAHLHKILVPAWAAILVLCHCIPLNKNYGVIIDLAQVPEQDKKLNTFALNEIKRRLTFQPEWFIVMREDAMLQIGLRAHDYGKNVTPETLADILAAYAPASIQLALAKSFVNAPQAGGLNPGYARLVRRALEKRGIAIAVLGCYINPVHPDADIREAQLRSFEEHLRFARDFGCALVGTETGSRAPDCGFHPDTAKNETFDLFCASLERLLAVAEKCGSIAAIEAVADQHTISSIEKMSEVLRRFPSPALRVIYDPVNLIPRAGLGESQERFFTRAFDAFGDKIAAVHAKDFISGKAKDLPAGTGELDWPALLGLIKARKNGIDILLENTSPQTGGQAMEFLRGMYAGL
jgi:sugar phosphate isomerase/epimerase